ncbi:putative protein Brevis radix-like 5 [Hordeum vulgare subsp. vulgare]|nr:putative protein Brevis radix-like 5 [Hordeum vulgare subsp. vulgare]
MHVCFRGGAGDSRAAKSISVVRGLAKNMKAMSLRAKAAGGAGHARRRQRKEADCDRHKDGSGAASAKITPAQLQDDRRHDRRLHKEEDCGKCCSPLLDDGGADDAGEKDDDGAGEWVAEPEPGVLMTLAPRPDGTNRLRRVRFRGELFDDWAAQSWWADNHDRIVELYSVVQPDDEAAAATPVTPCQQSDEEEPPPEEQLGSPSTSSFSGEPSTGRRSSGTAGSPILGLVTAPDTLGAKTLPTMTQNVTNNDDGEEEGGISDQQSGAQWREWVEEYEPGVFITVRAYPDHPLQLRHVELSREKFGEVKARVWWQENMDRLRSFYSF